MLAKITIIWFAASYGVALLLEVSRLFFRLPVRLIVMLGFGAAGLFAHTVFLWNEAQPGIAAGVPFSSWHLWFLLAAWILAALYLLLAATRPQTSIGIFMLPVILALVAAGHFADHQSFGDDEARTVWHRVHVVTLLLGTVTMALGFVAGLMYLVQSYRLKQKLPPRAGLRLPSLEWLQSLNKQTLYLSTLFVAGGLFAGIMLNLLKRGVPWTDPLTLASGGLFAWLLAATLFELLYKPAQQGRKVAYLTVANFACLVAVLGMAVFSGSQHAAPKEARVIPIAASTLPATWLNGSGVSP